VSCFLAVYGKENGYAFDFASRRAVTVDFISLSFSLFCLVCDFLPRTMGFFSFLEYKDDGASPRGCVFIVPGYISPGMKGYFASAAWKKIALVDTMLHRAANRSLDLTIERLGKAKFQAALDSFRHAQQVVQEKCLPVVQFPCTSSGEPVAQPNCFWGDSGCGTGCIDEVANELNLYTTSTKSLLE
jgi:hypothetical protein